MLLNKIREAVAAREKHVTEFLELSDSISDTHPSLVAEWTVAVQAWENDRTKPNPFAVATTGKYSLLF